MRCKASHIWVGAPRTLGSWVLTARHMLEITRWATASEIANVQQRARQVKRGHETYSSWSSNLSPEESLLKRSSCAAVRSVPLSCPATVPLKGELASAQ